MKKEAIIDFIWRNPFSSKSEICEGTGFPGSDSSLKRILLEAVESGLIIAEGKGRATKYAPVKYPDGVQTFEKIRSEGYLYVDKTDLVYSLVSRSSSYVFLSRPRRFGKSLLISTLKAYFEGDKDLFKGLSIESRESQWIRYPVVRIDLSTTADALDTSQLYLKLGNLLEENEDYLGLARNETLPGERLYSLVRRAQDKFGRKVVILIDEYDAPMLGAVYDNDRAEEFKSVVKEFFSPLKKLEPFLRFVFLTGITKFSQMSLFSTLNNLDDISLDDEFRSICGFTENELKRYFASSVRLLAGKAGISDQEASILIKRKYDGYHFSPACEDIYNPFSIMKVFSKMKLSDYWFSSGTPTLLFEALKRFNTQIYDIDGVEAPASVFDQPTESVTSVIPLFYQSGYLTLKSYSPDTDTYVLGIPNSEVRSGLMDNLLPSVADKTPVETQNVAIRFKRALIDNDLDLALDILKGFFASIPYPEFGSEALDSFEKKEAYFKRLFYIVFSFMNVQIYTEVMNSEGRTDAIMYLGDTVYIVEAKMDSTPEEALRQIRERGYADRFAGSGKKVICLGLDFSSKTRTIESWKTV
ncbi:MAG: ATP-binding protein [Bacteroidales bacterium]|nr:ATP-binding protein [Bacteroidales bacterium]